MTGHSTSLTIFFENRFTPEKLSRVESETVRTYAKAVRRFTSFCGTDVMMHTITEGLLERAHRSWIKEGMSTKTAKAYRVYLRAIVRHWRPDMCLKACGRRPGETNPVTIAGLAEQDQDIEGSLFRFFRDEYAKRKMIGARQSSVDQFRYVISRFAKHLGRVPMLTDLEDDTVSAFMAWAVNVAGLSKSTANNSRAYLMILWRYAHKRGLVAKLPADVDKLKTEKKLPRAWTVDEMGLILDSAKQEQYPKTGMCYPPGKYYPALILVAYDTGLRLKSLMGIRFGDWDLERREVTAQAETQKQGVDQTFEVSEQTAEAIEAMIAAKIWEEEPELLFPWPVRHEQIFRALNSILKRAGIAETKAGKNGLWHQLRRTCASHLAAAIGLEGACRQLGHSSVEMTRRYVDPRLTREHRAASHLPRPETKGNTDSKATKRGRS